VSVKPIPNDPMLTAGTDRCRCTACGAYFRRSGTFTEHRVGPWTNDGANRRCRTAAEMTALGWLIDEAGYWIQGRMPASAAAQRHSSRDRQKAVPEEGV